MSYNKPKLPKQLTHQIRILELKRITGEDFGSVSMYSTPHRLKQIQNRWAYWLLKVNKSSLKRN